MNNIFDNSRLDIEVTGILLHLGIKASNRGYGYLRKSIMLACYIPEVTGQVTKTLYPRIARICGVTSSEVERSCRHAIEKAYNGPNSPYMVKYFSSRAIYRKPTTREFINKIAAELREKTDLFYIVRNK